MKKAEEIFDEINDVRLSKQDVVEIIKQAQSEAIEETVKACADAAKVIRIKSDKSDLSYHTVDKQSILDVETKLKAKL